MVNEIKLLDCTLRDGAHLNGGNFGKKVITETIADLAEANIDIVEVGFFGNEKYGEDSTWFSSIADVKKILPQTKGKTKFSLMADFVDVSQVEPCDGTVEFFRLSFKRHRLEWGLNAARILMEKGYQCYINPVNCNVYTVEEYLEVIKAVNQLKPYGFSIVDTFGVLRKPSLAQMYYLLDANLDPEINIGLHLHENLGLAYSLAQNFLEMRNPRRSVTIDCSLLGMGRIPGNLCTEQIMDHLNICYGAEYSTEPALDAIDDFIAPIKRKIPWGYSVPYALSGKYGVHRTYAEFLIGKKRLKTKDIQRILSMIDKDHMEMFDEAYIEELYRKYVAVEYEDRDTIAYLNQKLKDRTIVVICPGSSIADHQGEILSFIEKHNAAVISVNFIPEFLTPDYAFCANAKRISNIKNAEKTERFITSNLIELADGAYEHAVSFNNCVYFNEVFCEDSTLMLLKVLVNCGCRAVSIAGFDGFVSYGNNYFSADYTSEEEDDNITAKTVKHILGTSLSKLQITFLTPSLYCRTGAEYQNMECEDRL